MNIIINVTGITENNRQEKLLAAANVLNKAMELDVQISGMSIEKSLSGGRKLRDIRLNVTDISVSNKRDKYCAAMYVLSKALSVPITIKRKPADEDHKEKFPYKSYEQLTQRFSYEYGAMLDSLYSSICRIFELPQMSTFSKSITPLVYNGKIIFSYKTGKPISRRQWERFSKALQKFLDENTKDKAHRIVVDSRMLGKILNRMLKYQKWSDVSGMDLNNITYDNKDFHKLTLDSNVRRVLYQQREMENKIELAEQHCAQYITGLNDTVKNDIQKTLIDGIQQHKTESQISQTLFDKFGRFNRDWQRIAEYEVNDNLNSSMVEAAVQDTKPGQKTYVQRYEVLDGVTCPYCRSINGKIAVWSNVPLSDDKISGDPYTDIAIWEGKSNVGRRSGDMWLPVGLAHPWCRGGWSRWIPEERDDLADALVAEMSDKRKIWDGAVDQATAEFQQRGIKHPNDRTKEFTERINDIYKSGK